MEKVTRPFESPFKARTSASQGNLSRGAAPVVAREPFRTSFQGADTCVTRQLPSSGAGRGGAAGDARRQGAMALGGSAGVSPAAAGPVDLLTELTAHWFLWACCQGVPSPLTCTPDLKASFSGKPGDPPGGGQRRRHRLQRRHPRQGGQLHGFAHAALLISKPASLTTAWRRARRRTAVLAF